MNLKTQLKEFEGCRLNGYLDTLGVVTIGYGHVDPSITIDTEWTQEQAEAQLDADIAEKTAQVRQHIPWFDRLNEPRQAVLIGMCFQLGLAGLLGFNRTLGSVRDERWDDAANGMLMSKWCKQTPQRCRRMAAQMATGEWQ